MITTWRRLKARGIMGINHRNLQFLQYFNQRRYFPLVDNKITTKQLAAAYGIATPLLYTSIQREHHNRSLARYLPQQAGFVIKPAHGSGGEGILVINSCINGRFRLSSGRLVSLEALQYHISNIISGKYSLGGQTDSAMIEQRIKFDPLFDAVTYRGVPDIRIICLQGFPIMAMVRLPTQESRGKANLHQGAVGAGICLRHGITHSGVWRNERMDYHPDTENPVANIAVPGWYGLLAMAAKTYEMTNLGYIGIDVVLDRDQGPLMLELNARPGLSIQIANHSGLLQPTRVIKQKIISLRRHLNYDERIRFMLSQEFGCDCNL